MQRRLNTRHLVTLFIAGPPEAPLPGMPFGRTRDVSRSGLFVYTGERPEVGARRHLSFVWGDETYVCDAEVIRHDGDGIALAFVAPPSELLRALDEILGYPHEFIPALDPP